MADFNLEAMSLKELRQLQKDLAKAISTYEDRHKAEARTKLEAIAKDAPPAAKHSRPADDSTAPAAKLNARDVYASRATSSLLLVRGEGFQEEHLTRLEKDIADLETSAQAAMSASSEIPGLTTKLVTQLRLGVSFGPNEDNMPWEYPQDLAKALRDRPGLKLELAGLADPEAEDEGLRRAALESAVDLRPHQPKPKQ